MQESSFYKSQLHLLPNVYYLVRSHMIPVNPVELTYSRALFSIVLNK